MNISSMPFIRDDYWPEDGAEYNEIGQLNQRIDETQSELALVNANLTNDIENVFNNLNIYIGEQADTSISNNIIVNNLNANYAEGRFANFDNSFTNNAYIENLTVNKPAFDITLNTPHLENATSLDGNFYKPNLIDARLIGDVSGDLNVVNVNQLNAVNAIIANLFVNHSAPPINACSVLGYDREGRVIPVYATYNVNFPEDADYVWTDFAGTSRKGIKATEIGEVDNLITAYGVKNAIDVVNANFNNVDNSFNDVNNSFNNVNNRIETEMSNIAENFNTDNLSANNAVISNLNVDSLSANNAVTNNLDVDSLSANNAATNSLNVDSLSANNAATNNLDVSDITIEKATGDNGQVIGKTDGKVKWVNVTDVNGKAIIDKVWPIGVIYVQFPQQKSPQELFPNTTWVELDYGGAFFRASGGNAAAFNGGKQEELVGPHSDSVTVTGGNHRHPYSFSDTHNGGEHDKPVAYDNSNNETTGYTGYSGDLSMSGTVNHTAKENRPANYTIRIWKRTA